MLLFKLGSEVDLDRETQHVMILLEALFYFGSFELQVLLVDLEGVLQKYQLVNLKFRIAIKFVLVSRKVLHYF